MAEEKAEYTKPSSQLDLEGRLAKGNEGSARYLSTADTVQQEVDDGLARDFRVEEQDVSEYIGTDRVYQNSASETHAPLLGDESAESLVAQHVASELAHTQPGVEVGSQEPALEEKEAMSESGIGMPESDAETDPHTPQDAVLNAHQYEGEVTVEADPNPGQGATRTAPKSTSSNTAGGSGDKAQTTKSGS